MALSEDVLLIVKNVRNKKTDGSLYLMGERLAWMQNSKESFTLSYMYSDIKLQKISPESKDKVQLQLVFHDGGANTFHFINPNGRSSQVADRDSVKEILQQLLPKFRRKISSELEQKNRLLQENPALFQMYKDLVVSQVLTADEFWAARSEQLEDVSRQDGKQSVGISAAFLADIKPQTDGCNGLKYNLTSDIIDSIFRTYPMVKQKHAEFVGSSMTESEFWTRFFQSHYFHRDRQHAGNVDMFSECAVQDEEVVREEIGKRVTDPFLNLVENSDHSLGPGYGSEKTNDSVKSSNDSLNLSLIRRFNHHSTMILKTCEGKSDSSNSVFAKNNRAEKTNSEDTGPNCTPIKKVRLSEKLHYDDLESNTTHDHATLHLQNLDRYLHGPTPITSLRYTTSDDVIHASSIVKQQLQEWTSKEFSGVPVSTAVSILGDLSPGGALMISTNQAQEVTDEDVSREVRNLYLALTELLRHFWTCFPTSTKDLEQKVIKMRDTLQRFETAKLHPMKDKLKNHHYSSNLTSHIEEMLESAYSKFTSWQSRKLNKK